jgi:molecular chaperone HtpG
MDCPDLPLNVSRSFLQNDGNISKMSGYISRKVADKLISMFRKDREEYVGYWDDIAPFIKYGCIKEKDFYDKIKSAVLFKTTEGDYVTLEEFIERNKDKTDKTVYYVSSEQLQSQYIKMFKDQGMEAVMLTTQLDNPFISYLESYEMSSGSGHSASEAERIKFNRIDSGISDALKDKKENAEETEEDKKEQEELEMLFRDALGNDKLKVSVETLKSESVSAVILLSEQARRMQEMSRMYGGGGMFGGMDMFQNEETLTLNRSHNLVKILTSLKSDPSRREDAHMIACQIFDLAMMGHKPLANDQMTKFIERSNMIMERLVK